MERHHQHTDRVNDLDKTYM